MQVSVQGRLITNPSKFFDGVTTQEGKHEYTAQIVLDDASVAKLEKARASVIAEVWGGKPLPSSVNDYTIRDGDDEEYESTFGKKFIIAKQKKSPAPKAFRKVNGQTEVVTAEDGLFYAGCYIGLSVDVYGSKGDKAKKIPAYLTVGLRAIMFLKDGEPLGAVVNADNEFSDFEDSEFAVADDF